MSVHRVVPVPELTALQQSIVAKAKGKAYGIVDDGMAVVAQGFGWREGEDPDEQADRLLLAFVAELRA